MCESLGNTDFLSANYDNKQSRDPAVLASTGHSSASLTTVAFRSREVRRFLFDLEPHV